MYTQIYICNNIYNTYIISFSILSFYKFKIIRIYVNCYVNINFQIEMNRFN